MIFKDTLNQYQKLINKNLDLYFNDTNSYYSRLDSSMKYSLMAGGKRLRPILILASYELFKKDNSVCLPFCMAMEMIHNFSLIHDDLPAIDNDDFRHGKLTNHKAFEESTAILAGDGLLNHSYSFLIENLCQEGDNLLLLKKLKALNELSNATNDMIHGEFVDIQWENKNITKEQLEFMHQNKTGALIVASVRIGAILAGCSINELEALTNYAKCIGLAFQIKDDILSEIGDEKITGKPTGNDREAGKCTFVTLFGIDKSQSILENTIKSAIDNLERFENSEFLKELAMYIKNREC